MNDWICLLINPTYYRRGKEVIESELLKIFGSNLIELRVIIDDDNQDAEEYYTFIRCRSYQEHVSQLMACRVVKSVLSTYENPVYLSHEDVKAFIESINEESIPDNLTVGDVVKVKEGYLSGLTGLVTRDRGSRVYDVMFKFHTRKFEEEIPITHLTLVDSIFDHLKMPVLTENLREHGILWACSTGIQFCGAN
jgi:transcription antitermination factor NusG